jgi:hypothetical protein
LKHPTSADRRTGRWLTLLALTCAACSGEIERNTSVSGVTPGVPGAPWAPGAKPSAPGQPGQPGGQLPQAGGGADATRDVNRVGIHRLNNSEYDNTVRDLLGVSTTPAASFITDEKALGFDNIADALRMTDAQYEQYFDAAAALTTATFADATLRAKIVSCTPAGAADEARCTEAIVTQFGKRAWRRPLLPAEVTKLTALAAEARALGEDFNGSIAHVVRALLSSVQFLYRIELDADPSSPVAHPLSDYELASRLSYLLWSTMPDAVLFAAAERGALQDDDELSAQLERMLADPRGARFSQGFAAQWLGLRGLASHQVEATVFPDFDEALRAAMIREGLAYFDEFLHEERSLTEFFSADVNFVDAKLAKHYGMTGSAFDPTKALSVTDDERRGFLGLASFLTFSSFAHRTAPTLRGKWVLDNLLCTEIPPPPPNVPELESGEADQTLNVRERLAEHRTNPQCASCHQILDPIGLGLENFDAIGGYRESYSAGDAVDASGMLPTGESFDGLFELTGLLADDPRLVDCATEKLLTYALSREVVESDQPYADEIRTRAEAAGGSVRALLAEIVRSDLFRQRRGEVAP